MRRIIFGLVIALLFLATLFSIIYTVDETQVVIVSQFGNPVLVVDEPGLHFKLPAPMQTLIRYDNRIMVFNARPSEYLTKDKKNIVVESFACWKIKDARKFLQTVKNRVGAQFRLGDMVASEIGAALGTIPLHALISTNPEDVKLGEIMKEVNTNCATKALKNYGIEIVTVKIKRLNFPNMNKIAVYSRMKSERKRIAKLYRAEGRQEAANIRAKTNKEVTEILSEAYKNAEIIKGEGDARAANIYAKAYKNDPGFYKMIRTLESYENFLDKQTTVILSSDAELLKFLGKGSGQ